AHILEGSQVKTTFGMLLGGLTLDEEAALLRTKTGRSVTILRDLDLAKFREELAHVNDPTHRYTVNFTRGPLFGRGGGHHSPIGAYLPEQDLVLVLDVNGRYKPWLVPSERLFRAVDTVDRQSKQKRGLLRID
ncbi:MAG: phytochelatin synthase family protein, partial [Ilumatobacteraceae bacterium]